MYQLVPTWHLWKIILSQLTQLNLSVQICVYYIVDSCLNMLVWFYLLNNKKVDITPPTDNCNFT